MKVEYDMNLYNTIKKTINHNLDAAMIKKPMYLETFKKSMVDLNFPKNGRFSFHYLVKMMEDPDIKIFEEKSLKIGFSFKQLMINKLDEYV